MSVASATTALAGYLASVAGVNSAVSGRIYRPQLDTDAVPSMPEACLVIRHAGGYQMFGGAQVPIGDPRLDIFCYGSTWLEAEQVSDQVVAALRALAHFTFQGTRLYWARIGAGPMPYEDSETNWPALMVSAQVAVCEVTAT